MFASDFAETVVNPLRSVAGQAITPMAIGTFKADLKRLSETITQPATHIHRDLDELLHSLGELLPLFKRVVLYSRRRAARDIEARASHIHEREVLDVTSNSKSVTFSVAACGSGPEGYATHKPLP